MPPDAKSSPFDRVRLLRALTSAERSRLEPGVTLRDCRRGEPFYAAGDPADVVCAVAQGVVKLSTRAPDGREVILDFVEQGEIFGELAILDDGPRDHAADAHEDSVVAVIERDRLTTIIREAPELGFQFNRVLATRVKALRARVEELLCKSAQTRMALTLSALAEAHGITDAGGVLIPLRLSQRDLAGLAGLSRETVNAVLQDFRSRDLVETNGRRLRILQPDGLRALRSSAGPKPCST